MSVVLSLESLPDTAIKPPKGCDTAIFGIAEVLKKLRINPAPVPGETDEPTRVSLTSAPPTGTVLRDHAKHAAGLNEDHDLPKKSPKSHKPDQAWFYPYGQEKYAHLLQDPVCICGVNVDEFSVKCQNGAISIILDSHRDIVPARWRSGEPVAQLLPLELEQRLKFGVPPAKLQVEEHKITIAHHASHPIPLPRLHPAGAHQMRHTINNSNQVIEAWQPFSFSAGDATDALQHTTASPILRLVRTVYEEQCLYNAVFFEAIRQCSVHCAERGQFLADLRKSYTALLHSTPNYLKRVHHEMLVQRSLDRRLVEHFTGCKEWWDRMQFRFEGIKESGRIGRTIELRYRKLPETSRFVCLLDNDNQLFKEYTRFFETQRVSLQLDQENMAFERELWQNLTHVLATELMDNPNYDEFRQLRNVQNVWLNKAKLAYQRVVVADQKQVLALREQTKVWLATLSQLEKRLADNDWAIYQTLTTVRADVEAAVYQFLDRQGPADDQDMLQDITDRLKGWIKSLTAVLSRFQATQAQQNLEFAEKGHVMFEELVVSTLVALVGRHRRERDFATGPIAPTDESQNTRILNAMEKNNLTDQAKLYAEASAPKARTTSVKEDLVDQSSEPDVINAGIGPKPEITICGPRTAETSQERQPSLKRPRDAYEESVEVFSQILRRYRQYETELSYLQTSQPYHELWSLWQRYRLIESSFHVRIFGDKGLPVAITCLEENMEQVLSMVTNNNCQYFSPNNPGRFCSAGLSFVHQIDLMLRSVRANFNVSALLAEPKTNPIRDFIKNARTWFLFCESNLEAMTLGILEKITDFSEKMLQIAVSLMVTVLPDQDFDEERYLQLYKKEADIKVEDKLDLIELRIGALALELGNFSRALDELEEIIIADEDAQNRSSESSLVTLPQIAEWNQLAQTLLAIAYDINGVWRGNLDGTAISRYRQKLEDAKTAVAHHQFNLPELMDLIETKRDNQDFVEITNLGDEVNIYLKPFCIATQENVDREHDPCTTQNTAFMKAQLAEQQQLTTKTQQRIRDLEEGITKAKLTNQQLEATVLALRNEQLDGSPMLAKYTEETMKVIQLISTDAVPEIMRSGRLPDVLEQQTLPDWESLVLNKDAESVFSRIENRSKYDFAAKMAEMAVLIRPHQLHMTHLKQAIEPLLVPDVDKEAGFRERKAVRDQKRADRWLEGEAIREERYKIQNAYPSVHISYA